MRLSTVLQVSFVGALMFSPAMADEIDQVHEQALKILRAQSAQPAQSSSSSSSSSIRGDRDSMRRQQAAEAELRRQQQQEERRKAFESQVQNRELERQRQNAQAVQSPNASGTMSPDELHARALEILHNQQRGGLSSSTASGNGVLAPSQIQSSQPVVAPTFNQPAANLTAVASPAPEQPSPEIQERARQILKQQQAEIKNSPTSVAAPQLAAPSQDEEALHQKALEILRQTMAGQQPISAIPAATVETTAPTHPEPINTAPAAAPALAPAAAPATASISAPAPAPSTQATSNGSDLNNGQIDLVHEQALRVLHQSTGQGSSPVFDVLDPQTKEMLRRQNAELSSQVGASQSSLPTLNSTPTNLGNMPQHELAPEMEARAREILRQQQMGSTPTAMAQPSAPATAASNASSVTAAPAAPATASSIAPAASNGNQNAPEQVQYSQQLEQRARQTILDHAQDAAQAPQPGNVTTAATPLPAPAQAPLVNTAPSTTPAPAATPAPAPAGSDADVAAIHAKALDTMEHVINPTPIEQSERILSGQKTRREKLQELTDLYKADKLTPAQYHEFRARILSQPK